MTKTQAFALKTQDYRDTSLLASFYTRDFGKLRGILKGARDGRERYGSTLEPFSLNEILVYRRRRGADLHQVTGAELLDEFAALRGDLERLSYASYCTELLDALTEVEDASPETFDLFLGTLRFLSSGVSPRRAARIFEVKLLGQVGLMPEVRSCVVCRSQASDVFYFHPSLGGVLCTGCQKPGTAGFAVSKGAVHFIEHVRRSEVKDLGHVKVSQEVGGEVEKTLRRFIDFHLPAKLKTVIFLEKMGLR